jgi:hypothetical protein
VALLHSNKPTGFPGANNVHGTTQTEEEVWGEDRRPQQKKIGKKARRRHSSSQQPHSHPLVATFGTTTDIAQ